ncbi:MAG: class I SAM-dependent methyltransferase [Termitinemataceae bacterium]|nr:MAG: class I SAM-dependent methyltransferase [Termitinemataceae bacterium]
MTYNEKTQYQCALLSSRLVKRFKVLQKWAKRVGAGVYRLYSRDIPEIPLVLDYYIGEEQNSSYVCGALFKRPYYKSAEEEGAWILAMSSAISTAVNVPLENIFIKIRQTLHTKKEMAYNGESAYQYCKTEGTKKIIVKEGILRYELELCSYIDAGLFPDLRKARAFIKENAAGKSVLNLFCYTGSFSVNAASGGACKIDSVDMSATYLKTAEKNFALNSFKNSKYSFIRADVIRFLDDAVQKKQKWDIIILDPPVFSASKKMQGNALGGTMDILRDFNFLMAKCLKLLNKGGLLLFSTHAKSFKLNEAEFVQTYSALYPALSIKNRTEMFRDEDFRKHRVPAVYVVHL